MAGETACGLFITMTKQTKQTTYGYNDIHSKWIRINGR